MTAAPIDEVRVLPREHACGWCGRVYDAPMWSYGTRHNGDVYWSGPLCGRECHDEATSEDGDR